MRNDGRNRNSLIFEARMQAFQKLGREAQSLKFIRAESDGIHLVEHYDSPTALITIFYKPRKYNYRTTIVKQPKLFNI